MLLILGFYAIFLSVVIYSACKKWQPKRQPVELVEAKKPQLKLIRREK